jgi:hypothetical protein
LFEIIIFARYAMKLPNTGTGVGAFMIVDLWPSVLLALQ